MSCLCLWTSAAWGGGFALVQQGTAAMAQGNAFVAEADDASAIFYNPAGLTQLKRPQVYQGFFLNYPDRDYSGDGLDSETNHRFYKSMTVFCALPIKKQVALGIGFFSPFGMGTAWPPTWAGRYITTFSSLKTYNLNPTVSVKVLKNLSVGAGFDVMWSKVQLKRRSQVLGGALPDAEINLSGKGQGWGYNMGLLYEPLSGVKLGFSYRSQILVQHNGDFAIAMPSPLKSPPVVQGSAALIFPASMTMGVSYSRFNPFTFDPSSTVNADFLA